MASGVRLTSPGRAWALLAALLLLGSLLAWGLPAAWLDWQPERALAEPWRAWTAAWLHWSGQHLLANAAGTLVVGVFGVAARLPPAAAAAWFVAWPLTQAGLWLRPDLAHYGGLSGVLHAGVAVAVVWLLACATGARRAVGAAVGIGLLIKLGTERPWGDALQHPAEWDIALAPVAHATGAGAGLVCAALALLIQAARHRLQGPMPETRRP